MFVRCWFVYLILHLIDKVSLQDPDDILGYAGDSVILPCSYQERELTPEEINVFWRYNKNIIAYDIEKGIPSTKEQNPKFKDRIDSFSSEYGNGNFSLRLSSLELTDTGQFSCSVPGVSMKHKLTLLVRAPPTTVPSTTVPSTTASTPKSKSDTRSSSIKVQADGIVTFLFVVLVLLDCCLDKLCFTLVPELGPQMY